MYFKREFGKKRENCGVLARIVLSLTGRFPLAGNGKTLPPRHIIPKTDFFPEVSFRFFIFFKDYAPYFAAA